MPKNFNTPFAVRDFRKARFFWLDNEVVDVYLPKLGGTAFAVYCYLCRFVNNETQTCWPSMAQMAEKLQLSKSTISRSLQTLEEHKLIHTVAKGRQHISSQYQLLDISQSSTGGTLDSESRVPQNGSSVPKQPIQSSATVPEQDLYNNPKEQPSNPPPSEKGSKTDTRTQGFRKLIQVAHEFKTKTWPGWGPAVGSQLKRLLLANPDLMEEEFKQWLRNYWASEINAAKMPHEYLPELHRFRLNPLDRYGHPLGGNNGKQNRAVERAIRNANVVVRGTAAYRGEPVGGNGVGDVERPNRSGSQSMAGLPLALSRGSDPLGVSQTSRDGDLFPETGRDN